MAAVMTIFEGTVPQADQVRLEAMWKDIAQNKPDELLRSWLIQSVEDETTWCAVALWRSREGFIDYQASVEHLPTNEMFRSLGVIPVLAAFEVVEEG
jgi:hypothetical protein